MKILVIEDNEQDQKIFKRFLNKAGYENVVFADSGEEGLEKLRAERPEVVITDTNLPGMNGFETCKRIKDEHGPGFKVIVMTGSVDAVDAGKARKMGADDYCVKTSDGLPLVDAIKRLGVSGPPPGEASPPTGAEAG